MIAVKQMRLEVVKCFNVKKAESLCLPISLPVIGDMNKSQTVSVITKCDG